MSIRKSMVAASLALVLGGLPWLAQSAEAATSPAAKGPEASKDVSAESQPDEKILRERIQARWDALKVMDMAKVYEFATPAYRQAYNLAHLNNQYGAQIDREKIVIDEIEFVDGELPSAKVLLTLHYTTDGFEPGRKLNLQGPVKETWVRIDGQWWYVETQ